ncbi:NAD-dependent epimerase/dehydratase family protein [Gordonia sp. Swx-4]|uniref:NAD-dependent epimerase/dehydratase family protein n=1 Tax=Gordonia sp. Swx-4 TaxID=3029399 RepID=UPI0025742E2A|nr:NAD-dependent epimerase/dehydratase family protein [Gordonia sp. Swx-4]WJG14458.1 NAD-dependent epimerase/dehydratase family protein [Gordonia sp. Swx-4]
MTGAAGFIGAAVSRRLLDDSVTVLGIDNLNDYYDVRLKEARLKPLNTSPDFEFARVDVADMTSLRDLVFEFDPDVIVHLAAQAGVRYSLENPHAYVKSNIEGFLNVLELCRELQRRSESRFKKLVYASSSSVYGASADVPYRVSATADQPVSLYAASKRSNELMAYAYSSAFGIESVGLRFFTVYGPYGRPDMAYFKFANMLVRGQSIPVFNGGKMERDFTYVDDIVNGVTASMGYVFSSESTVKHRVFNLGNSKPVNLMEFIDCLEGELIKKGLVQTAGKRDFLPMQTGDVPQTYADIGESSRELGFFPVTDIQSGLASFVDWFHSYYPNAI